MDEKGFKIQKRPKTLAKLEKFKRGRDTAVLRS